MQLAKSTFYRINKSRFQILCTIVLLLFVECVFAQENSPYSRYGIGDMVPNTNIINRGMGGISAGYSDVLSINFNNPASFSKFQTQPVPGSNKKIRSGRVLFDVGVDYNSRTLIAPNQPLNFSSSYGYFSYIQVGLPINKKWGLSFGLRPVSRINYKISRLEPLNDPITGNFIDSAISSFEGNGGAFLPTFGTGYSFRNLSIGASIGYSFGKKDVTTKRILLNDDANYQASSYASRAYFGGIYYTLGAQYTITLKKDKDKENVLRLGISGNLKQEHNATRDILRGTFVTDANGSDQRLDSVYERTEERGKMILPGSYTAGFVIEHKETTGRGWLFGLDYVATQWNDYRFFNEVDAVQNSSQVRIGGQIRPKPSTNYFSNVAYRAGFFTGTDYIKVVNELPLYGVTFGMSLPIGNYSRSSPGQFTMINLGFEFSKRGNNDNLLKENMFRFTAGLNFSDLWFNKRRYD